MAKAKLSDAGEGKIYNINVREAYKKSVRKRSPYAIRYVKGYLKKHTKASEVKIGPELNKTLWARGMKRPPASVRVKAVYDGLTVKAELVGFEYKDFKAKPREEKKSAKEKLLERLGPKAVQKEQEEKMIDGKAVKENSGTGAKDDTKEEKNKAASS